MSKQFQRIHSDELKAVVIDLALGPKKLSGAALGRMIREGKIQGFEANHISDDTVRDWIKKARADNEVADLTRLEKMAKKALDLAEREIDEITKISDPRRNKADRQPVDPLQLRRLLETAEQAHKVLNPEAGPQDPAKKPEVPADPAAAQVAAAFDQ